RGDVGRQAVSVLRHRSVDRVAAGKRTLAGLALLLLAAAGCSGSSTTSQPDAGKAAGRRPAVEFLGPDRLERPADLRAEARAAAGSRVVAVTFILDGRPLGSDTTRPYRLDVDPALLARGRHRVRVEAVDSLGRRGTTAAGPLSVEASGSLIVDAAPGPSFARAREALERGDVTVRLAPGRYVVDELELGSGARLVGSGPRTVLAAPRGRRYWALVVARGRNIRIADLAVDGGGAVPRDEEGGIGIAVFDGSSDVRLQRLRITRVRTDGVNTWGAHSGVSLQDSVIEGGGTAEAGFVALGSDETRDTSVIRSAVRGFRGFGILLQQQAHGRPAADLHGVVLDNVVSDIRDPSRDGCWTAAKYRTPGCGTNEGGIWTGGVEAAVIGNTVRRARWDGIETVGSSTRTTIVGNRIYDTRTGIYLEHATHRSLISRNVIVDALVGINVEWWHEGAGSSRNTFAFNRIVRSKAGIVLDVGSDGNRIVGNVFVGGLRPSIVLQGASDNVVRDNVGCGSRGDSLVSFSEARYDDGRPAVSKQNRLDGNESRDSAC
ncbi:MAG TPA: right-handed parallel beta-helix repeat-containing protein, partial [Gaiellaceae bacterium]|nr:right-handed parallel beta-helix repeat-containing protein [Gaiellaceae bacterium]